MRFKAVVFDWAGTLIDFGSVAPMDTFVQAFSKVGIQLTIAQARGPMGSAKRDHIRALFELPEIASQWRAQYGYAPNEAAIDQVYEIFVPLTETVVTEHAALIPGALDCISALRAQGMRIGTTTGYTRSIMEQVLPLVEKQGFVPDALVCADDLIEGRPGPLGIYKNMVDMAVYPPQEIVKVDDTAPGLAEGRSAGCLTVGLALSGNEAGLSVSQLAALKEDERDALRQRATQSLTNAGADYVIDSVADLPDLLERLS